MTYYKAEIISLKGRNRIAVQFENKAELIAQFKKLKGREWSRSKKT